MEKSSIFTAGVTETKEALLNRTGFTLGFFPIRFVLQEVVEDGMSSTDCQNNPADNCHLFEEVIIRRKVTSDNISHILDT